MNKTTLIAGRVKWYAPTKGYGFIETDTLQDVFVHYSAIKSNTKETNALFGAEELIPYLEEGELVLFELVTGPKGTQAFNVVRAKEALV